MFSEVVAFVKSIYPNQDVIPLHAPTFVGKEKEYLSDCVDSTFVSSVGEFVNQFERMICEKTGARHAVATVNGTSALHAALLAVGVKEGEEVLCPALTFVATANAIAYSSARPVFVDSSSHNLGMSPESLEEFLESHAELREDGAFNKKTQKRIAACIPMHVFGHMAEIEKIVSICRKYKIAVVEDAAESLGTWSGETHSGLTGDVGILSFNGNKIITCGGGGMLITNDQSAAERAKHLTTTAKVAHKWDFFHDQVGFNYRLPNLNAALGCAQLEVLENFIENKRETAAMYSDFFAGLGVEVVKEPAGTKSNYWLNAVRLKSKAERDAFLAETNAAGILTRPIWDLMTDLPAYKDCQKTEMVNARSYVDTIVNLPSSVRQ